MKTLGSLKANPNNPRKISETRVKMLAKALKEFGDLSGFVYNRVSKRLVGGHQRQKAMPPDAKIKILRRYERPTKTGTVAVGYVLSRGERFAYREVVWTPSRESAANIAANRGAGEWDWEKLSTMMRELDSESFDLDLTMFEKDELGDLLTPTTSPNFEEGSEDDQGQLDRKKPVECPECGHEFVPESKR